MCARAEHLCAGATIVSHSRLTAPWTDENTVGTPVSRSGSGWGAGWRGRSLPRAAWWDTDKLEAKLDLEDSDDMTPMVEDQLTNWNVNSLARSRAAAVDNAGSPARQPLLVVITFDVCLVLGDNQPAESTTRQQARRKFGFGYGAGAGAGSGPKESQSVFSYPMNQILQASSALG